MSFTHDELKTLWVNAGGNPPEADIAAAIAQAESGGCQYAKAGPTDDRPTNACTYRYTTTENSYGLWQINRDAHPDYTAATLYTAAGNAAAAVAISQNGLDFSPWTTYTDGAFNAYLPAGTTTGPIQSPGTLSGQPFQNQVGAAWMRLMRTLAITAPRSLRAQAKARARLNRAVR